MNLAIQQELTASVIKKKRPESKRLIYAEAFSVIALWKILQLQRSTAQSICWKCQDQRSHYHPSAFMGIKQTRTMEELMKKTDRSVCVATGNGIYTLYWEVVRTSHMKSKLGSVFDGKLRICLFYRYYWNQSHRFDLVLISFLHVRSS